MKELNLDMNSKVRVEFDVIDKGNFFNVDVPYHGVVKGYKLSELPKIIIEMIEGYAHELDTDIDNLNYKLTNLVILED